VAQGTDSCEIVCCFVHALHFGFCFVSTGKGNEPQQAGPEPVPSKRPTASVRRAKTQVVEEARGPPRKQRKVARYQAAHAQAQAHYRPDLLIYIYI
jgi:hypothetical protein